MSSQGPSASESSNVDAELCDTIAVTGNDLWFDEDSSQPPICGTCGVTMLPGPPLHGDDFECANDDCEASGSES